MSNGYTLPDDTKGRIDGILFKFAAYIKHHERTALGGPYNQFSTLQAIQSEIDRAVREARIDELNRPRTYSKPIAQGYEYDDGYWEAMNQVSNADERRVLELQAQINELEKEKS